MIPRCECGSYLTSKERVMRNVVKHKRAGTTCVPCLSGVLRRAGKPTEERRVREWRPEFKLPGRHALTRPPA